MAPSEAVRRAYERGRIIHGARRAAPHAAVLVAVPLVTGAGTGWAVVGAMLALVAAVAFWRGGLAGRAARAGLIAGLAPLAAPIAVGAFGHRCGGCALPVSLPLCIVVCVTGGAIAGLLLGSLAWREADRLRFSSVAVGFAAAAGTIGCLFAGVAGLVGMGIGLAVGGVAPLVVAPRSR